MSAVPSEISKYMGNAVKLADIWGSVMVNVKAAPFYAKGDGVKDDSSSIRKAIAAIQDGETLFFPKGIYHISKDGFNNYCIKVTKKIKVVADGAVFVCNSSSVNSVIRLSNSVLWENGVIDGNNKANMALFIDINGGESSVIGVEAKNVTQAYITTQAASVFAVDSATGVSFENCFAHDAISYPNGVEGDDYGASRGFHFFGSSQKYGINKVINCRVDNIKNINGLLGSFEDEDGIVAQMSNSFTVISKNVITNCMKRGIKFQSPGLAELNKIICARNGPFDGSKTRMRAAISIYSNNASTNNNEIGTDNTFGGTLGGSYIISVIEIGSGGLTYKDILIKDDIIKIGPNSDATGVALIRCFGFPKLSIDGVKGLVDDGATLSSTSGISLDSDSTTDYMNVNISKCEFKRLTNGIYSRGGVIGQIYSNTFEALSGVGMLFDSHSYTLGPKSVAFLMNEFKDYTTASYGIRVLDPKASNLTFGSNTGTGFQVASVVSGIRYTSMSNVGSGDNAINTASAAPTTGTWLVGDKVWNSAPTASGKIGWVCVTAGTPGTWKAFGVIDA